MCHISLRYRWVPGQPPTHVLQRELLPTLKDNHSLRDPDGPWIACHAGAERAKDVQAGLAGQHSGREQRQLELALSRGLLAHDRAWRILPHFCLDRMHQALHYWQLERAYSV